MSRNVFSHLYVQRWEGTFVVRQCTGREPLPSDEIVHRFELREDAHAYTNVMNETQDRIEQQEKGASPRGGEAAPHTFDESSPDIPTGYGIEQHPRDGFYAYRVSENGIPLYLKEPQHGLDAVFLSREDALAAICIKEKASLDMHRENAYTIPDN